MKKVQLNGNFNVTVVNSFKEDEPLQEVLQAARSLPEVKFFITGNTGKANPQTLVAGAPGNVSFTGFLPTERYYGLLNASHAVMCSRACVTTRFSAGPARRSPLKSRSSLQAGPC